MTELATITGTVLAWNAATGENTIKIGADMICNCVVLSGAGQAFEPGDAAVLLRKHDRFFVLGRRA